MSAPLEGLRVIDCSRGLAGTRATGLLADYGADVIWVEPPGGDPFRDSLAIAYASANRGKRSVELDLRSPAGHDALLGLLETADVFVESWRPGVADRLGIGFDAIHEQFPDLVGCSISGFGADGPNRDVHGYESLVQAHVGAMGEQFGYRSGPIYGAVPFASMGAGYLACVGILGALLRRTDDGRGRHVETSLLDGALAYLSMMWGDSDDADARPPLGAGARRLVARTFCCADDEYLGVHTGAVGAFDRLMAVLGLADAFPVTTPGVDMGVALSPEQLVLVEHRLPEIIASTDRASWLERLLAADVCAIPALRPTEVFDEPQARHNEMILELDDPVLGWVEQVAPAVKFPELGSPAHAPAPTVGQHNDVVASNPAAHAAAGPDVDARGPSASSLLDGLKVLDLGAFFAGPYSSRLLADLGADVIKLEPIAGDQLRGIERCFNSAQAGKRSVALDLKDPGVQPAIRGLLEWADVVHHNMRPGAAERLGVGYEQAAAVNPRIVYMHAPGWGSSGPNRVRQSFEPLMSGYVGVSHEAGGQWNPPTASLCNADPGNGLLGAISILIGLLHRRRTGEGVLVENPQLNAAMAHLGHIVRRPDGEVLGAARLDPLQLGVSPLDRLYETTDGWICVVAVHDADITALGRAAGVELLDDPRFATAAAREQHADALADLLATALARRSTADWAADLGSRSVPFAVPVRQNNAAAFLRDRENLRTGRVAELEHTGHGQVRELAVLVRVGDTATAAHRLAPGLGAHTHEVLRSLGYDVDDLAELRRRGAVRYDESDRVPSP
ncbi:MAG: dddD [Actinomycetia bacterium]|nr:dddD [Actinomycetes bacterium]